MSELITYDAEKVDLTAGNYDVVSDHVGALMAVAASGNVAVKLRGGTTCTLWLVQGVPFRCDVQQVLTSGTDAAFTSAAGDILALLDKQF